MNKKIITMGVSVTLGALLLATTAFAGLSGASGYDTYKTALKTTVAAESVTSQIEVIVKDNGTVIENIQVASKLDINDQSMSSNVNIADESIGIFSNDGQFVIKNSNTDVYKVMATEEGTNPHQDVDVNAMLESDHVQKMESVVDAFSTGVLKYITTSNNIDGTKEVAINLNGNQVPATLNAMASVAFTNMDTERNTEYFQDMPKFVSGVAIEGINVSAQIGQDNLITEQNQTFVISGIDADGVKHEVEVTVNVSFTDYNITKTDKVDTTGKTVEVIEQTERTERSHR